MRIWHGYGSEHSANIVLIGEFTTPEEAQGAHDLITLLTDLAGVDMNNDVVHPWSRNEQLSEETERKLRDLELHSIAPSDMADFAFVSASIQRDGNKVRLRTDDVDIGAFVKVMVEKGAKVLVYSAHTYPDNDRIQ